MSKQRGLIKRTEGDDGVCVQDRERIDARERRREGFKRGETISKEGGRRECVRTEEEMKLQKKR